jgi:rhamnosyltransferase
MADRQECGNVIVFYWPDAACVRRANRLATFSYCVVIDNTEEGVRPPGLNPSIVYIPNGRNLGIATAINLGVEYLLKSGFRYALLFDQDSEPSRELVERLPAVLHQEAANRRVALIGPAYEDVRLGGVAPFVRFRYVRLERVVPSGNKPIDVDFLISSGSCINLAAWRDIGQMDDSLFIDFVDLEWCVRARSRGYAVLGAPDVRLAHELGGEPIRILGRPYPSHSPLRHYYLFRNAIALVRRDYVPWTWKSTELAKLPVRLVIYALFLKPRLQHLRMACVGIWHGMTGRMGPLAR